MTKDDKIKGLIKQAIAWSTQNKLPKAMQMFRHVLALDPANFDALQGMGIVTARMGNIDEALRFFTRA